MCWCCNCLLTVHERGNMHELAVWFRNIIDGSTTCWAEESIHGPSTLRCRYTQDISAGRREKIGQRERSITCSKTLRKFCRQSSALCTAQCRSRICSSRIRATFWKARNLRVAWRIQLILYQVCLKAVPHLLGPSLSCFQPSNGRSRSCKKRKR